MDSLMASAKAYEALLNKEYIMTIGRKGKSEKFKLIFTNSDFKHLAGIHKLVDLEIHLVNADAVFSFALNGTLSLENIKESIHYHEMCERMENLKNLENYLDNNMLVFKWDLRKAVYTRKNTDNAL